MTLFKPGPRPAGRDLPATASAYERLDCDPTAHGSEIRNVLERWFVQLPEYARPAISAAFRGRTLADHLSGFWELYVHALAVSLGYEVEVDIGREDQDRRRPDFLLREGGSTLFVEATVVLGDDAVHPSDRTRVDQLYDAIERIAVRDYLLCVRTIRVGQTTPGRRTIGRPLERWLRSLDYEAVLALRDGNQPRPRQTFRFDDWIVSIKASAWLPALRDRSDLSVIGSKMEGIGDVTEGDTFKRLDDIGPVGRELRRKANWYGKSDRPFVIAALCAGPFASEHDIAQGLIGPIRYQINSRGGGVTGHYTPGGLWYGPDGLRNRRVSGVLTASGLRPTSIAAVEPVIWTAPQATHPLSCTAPLQVLAFDQEAGVTDRPATATVAQLLKLA